MLDIIFKNRAAKL